MAFLSLHAASAWSVLLLLFGVPEHWLSNRPIKNDDKASGPVHASTFRPAVEGRQQAVFLAMVTAEIASMRRAIREDEMDTASLRHRLDAAIAQSLMLRAAQEIMERRIARLRNDRAQRGL